MSVTLLTGYFLISTDDSFFFVEYDNELDVKNTSELYDYCVSQLPDFPPATVTIVNGTTRESKTNYSYCRVDNGRGIFVGSTTTFQSELVQF